MDIEKIIMEILEIKKTLQVHNQDYMHDSDLTTIIDNQLNAKIPLLRLSLKYNHLNEYLNIIDSIQLPIYKDAIQVVDLVDSIKDDIIQCIRWNKPKARLELINKLAYTMQEKYDIHSIDILFNSLGIECGDEYYTLNSKRVYVQNVLKKEPITKIIELAKCQNIFNDLIKIENNILSNNYMEEQIQKCVTKINNSDYDGAITNARTLIEDILLSIEEKILGERQKNEGDLLKLYKRVRKLLKLEPEDSKIDNSLYEITLGIMNIINGFACLSNNSGDRHACKYKIDKRHALFTINTMFSICQFLIESYQFQYVLE